MQPLNRKKTGIRQIPERILQFGTGVLLRGLPDYFVDQANRQGVFNGSILVVKSTTGVLLDTFEKQDGLFTLVVRGIRDGQIVDETLLNSSIDRVLSAESHWREILKAATAPDIDIIISNTTEMGINLMSDDDLNAQPPRSFPGKLTAILFEKFCKYGEASAKGFVILPTELISDNGDKLKAIVLEMAASNGLGNAFSHWVRQQNYFCNTLVDRIVPGALSPGEKEEMEAKLGYRDELMIMAEPYFLWAIETNDEVVRDRLAFANELPGMVLSPDIRKFRELKLRLLNGTHSISCALALLYGYRNVKAAMDDPGFRSFVTDIMEQEIIPATISADISAQEAKTFAASVVDRFSNPFLDHQWSSISLNYSSKMDTRCVPLIKAYADRTGSVPHLHALGFAAYLLLIKRMPDLKDERSPFIHALWKQLTSDELVDIILSNRELWSARLDEIPGFAKEVKEALCRLNDAYVIKQAIEKN